MSCGDVSVRWTGIVEMRVNRDRLGRSERFCLNSGTHDKWDLKSSVGQQWQFSAQDVVGVYAFTCSIAELKGVQDTISSSYVTSTFPPAVLASSPRRPLAASDCPTCAPSKKLGLDLQSTLSLRCTGRSKTTTSPSRVDNHEIASIV